MNTQIGTFARLPQVVEAVAVPVIAAGGIADAKGVAAAMALGAAGVQIGTAYRLCPGDDQRRAQGGAPRGVYVYRVSSPDDPMEIVPYRL